MRGLYGRGLGGHGVRTRPLHVLLELTMEQDRDRRALEVLELLLGLPRSARPKELRAQCNGNSELEARVLELLAADDQASSFLGEGAAAEHAARFDVGDRIGDFEIEGLIGAGGMGEVYRARDRRLPRSVAIKVLPREYGEGEAGGTLRQRFLREAQSISRLTHPRICTLHDVGCEDGIDYLVMELLEGESLADEIARGPLDVEHTLSTAIEIADAVCYAHSQDIVHRDLKPSNVIRTATGVKVLDFGLAKAVARGELGSDRLGSASDVDTATGVLLGTCAYMSPEQARGEATGRQTDIWAFGCILYEMLSGERPFSGESSADVLVGVLDREPRWEALRETLPATLFRVLQRCLAKDVTRRYHDLADVRLELEELAVDGADAAPPFPRKRRSSVAVVVGLAAALVSAVLTWLAVSTNGRDAVTEGYAPEIVTRLSILPPVDTQLAAFGKGYEGLAMSRDGRRVAFVARRDGVKQIYVRNLDDAECVVVPGSQNADVPFFSPDGEEIAFCTDSGLYTVSLRGGRPTQLSGEQGGPGTWGERDIIAYQSRDRLWLLDAKRGGTPRRLEFRPSVADYDARWPTFLPGGRHVLLHSREGVPRVVSIDDGTWTELAGLRGSSFRYLDSGHVVFAREDKLLMAPFDLAMRRVSGREQQILGDMRFSALTGGAYYAISSKGVLAYLPGSLAHHGELVWHRPGVEDIPVQGLQSGRFGQFALSRDGKYLAYSVHRPEPQVWILDLASAESLRLAVDASHPIWPPDGKHVYYRAVRDGETGLYRAVPRTGADEELLVKVARISFPCDVSPDGRALLYMMDDPQTADDLWVLPLAGSDRKPWRFFSTDEEDWCGKFSPDGRWVAISRHSEITLAPYPEGSPAVSLGTGEVPIWSQDSDVLYHRWANQWFRRSVVFEPTMQVGTPEVVFEGPYLNVNGYDYAVDEAKRRYLVFRSALDSPREIRVVRGLLPSRRWSAQAAD